MRQGVRRTYTAEGRLDQAAVTTLGGTWPEFLAGRLGVAASVEEQADGARRGDVRLDLNDAAFELPALGVVSRAGAGGTARTRFEMPDPRTLSLTDLVVDASGLAVEGMWR